MSNIINPRFQMFEVGVNYSNTEYLALFFQFANMSYFKKNQFIVKLKK